MNFHDPIINTLYIIASLIQFVLYCYFFKHFLKPKYQYSSLFSFLCMTLFLIMTLINKDFFLFKSLIAFVYMEAISFLFYDGTLTKKLVAGPIVLISTCIPDFLSQFIMVFIFQYPVFLDAPYPVILTMFMILDVFLYIIIILILKYFDYHFMIQSQYFQLFVNLVIIDFILSIMITESLILLKHFSVANQSQNIPQVFIAYSICFFIVLFFIYKTYHQIKTLKQDIALELTIQQLHTCYLEQLEDYIYIKNNDESIRYLRHDIMNYLQTIQTYQQRNGDE